MTDGQSQQPSTVVTFNFNTTMTPTDNQMRVRNSTEFITAYGAAYYEWVLTVGHSNLGGIRNLLMGNPRRPPQAEMRLEPTFQSLHVRIPTALRCHFNLAIVNEEGKVIQHASYIAEAGTTHDFHESPEFRVPSSTKLGELVQATFGDFSRKKCQVALSLELPSAAFSLGEWSGAMPVPENLDWRFNVLTNPTRLDLPLHCKNGVLIVNREACFMASQHFRGLLSQTPNLKEVVVDATVEAVDSVIVYMLTGTFKCPQNITSRLVHEMLSTATIFRVLVFKDYVASIERISCQQLIQAKENLEEILNWLLLSQELDLPRLRNAAASLLLCQHFNQLLSDYSNLPPLADEERVALHAKLHQRVGMFRPPAFDQLIMLSRGTRFVRPTVRDVEAAE